MKNIHIDNSYSIWSLGHMKSEIIHKCHILYGSMSADLVLNRTWCSMYIEWYLHNIAYYITFPLKRIEYFDSLNKRAKDVDLEEYPNKRGDKDEGRS